MEALLDTCGRGRVKPLLLIYLLVVKAAADCPKPLGGENVVLTNEALLLNDFPEEAVVTLECANGYYKESGSEIITCTGGTWTEPDLTCKKIDCGLPPSQPNMSFDISTGTLFGDVIRVICDKGYKVSGSSYKQCYPAGWSGRARCNIVTCAAPGSVDNGRSSWDSQALPKYGEIIQYSCNEGYTLVGKSSIVCSKSGEYDSQTPQCEGVTTEDIITAKTPTSTPPPQETSTTGSSATPTAHRDKTIMTSPTPAASPSPRGFILTAGGRTTTASTLQTSFEDQDSGAVDTNKDFGNIPVIASVTSSLIVAFIIGAFLYKYRLRKKGSYDTREDLKPELLQFQNL